MKKLTDEMKELRKNNTMYQQQWTILREKEDKRLAKAGFQPLKVEYYKNKNEQIIKEI